MNNNKTDLTDFNFDEFKEAALEGEMDSHLEESHEGGVPHRRNGKSRKTVKTGTESLELMTPRDRDGSFEPEIMKKRQAILNESLDNELPQIIFIIFT